MHFKTLISRNSEYKKGTIIRTGITKPTKKPDQHPKILVAECLGSVRAGWQHPQNQSMSSKSI